MTSSNPLASGLQRVPSCPERLIGPLQLSVIPGITTYALFTPPAELIEIHGYWPLLLGLSAAILVQLWLIWSQI